MSLFLNKSAKKAYIQPIIGVNRGTIPSWINGSLYRVGPAKYEVGPDHYKHMFDGLAMIQRYSVKDGQVVFNSQYIQSNAYLKNMAANRIVVSEFGTAVYPDPCQSIFGRLFSSWKTEMTDNTSVCVYALGDELFTATETNVIHRIDSIDLSTLGSVRLPNVLSIHRATAHFHMDMNSDNVHLLAFIHYPSPSYAFVTLPPISKEQSSTMTEKYDMEKLLTEAKIVGKIGTRWKWNPSYVHSFGMTENYFVLFECPLTISVLDFYKPHLKPVPTSNAIKWWPQEKTVIHIMDKRTGDLIQNTYVTDPLFTFHHINAFEESGCIVIDYCGYNDGSIITDLDVKTEITFSSFARRIVVPLNIDEKCSENANLVNLPGTSCTATIVQRDNKGLVIHCNPEDLYSDITLEMPTINYNAYNGKKYRYLYGINEYQVIKIDTVTKKSLAWSNDNKESNTGESLFVKNPDADDNNPEDEDYGILLCPVIIKDEAVETGRYQSLVFIDAKTMLEIGRAEFSSVSIPFAFHGLFQNTA